jgi:hypothetical protein
MKIKFYRYIVFAILFLCPSLVFAQLMVVRTDGNKVYIDTSSLHRHVQKGETFKIILSSEKLVNPSTGKELGLVHTYSAEGKITEVQPLYAVGELPSSDKIKVGQEAVLEEKVAKEDLSQTAKKAKLATKEKTPASLRKTFTYEPIQQEIISLTEAAITTPRANELITLSKKGEVTVWNRQGEVLQKLLSYQIPHNKTPLTISADRVREWQYAEIFVSVYDKVREKISTLVLANENGTLKEIETLPYFVKELGCGKEKDIFAQKPFVSGNKPGNARELDYEKGRFKLDDDSFSTQRHWLTGVNRYDVTKDDSDNVLYTSSNGQIRMTLPFGKRAESKSIFATAPNRVKYKQEVLEFYPSLQVFGPDGRATIAAVENTAKMGLLSDTFGQYQSGKIHFLAFEKGRLTITDTVELDGFVYDTACSDTAILTAEILPDGTSSIVEILK